MFKHYSNQIIMNFKFQIFTLTNYILENLQEEFINWTLLVNFGVLYLNIDFHNLMYIIMAHVFVNLQ